MSESPTSAPTPADYGELADGVAEILISAAAIQARVQELGVEISRDYEGCTPLLVGVLKGVIPFMADLMRAIHIPLTVDYLAIASFQAGRSGQPGVRLQKDLDESITGRHILFVEDVIDTGLTLSYLLRTLEARDPASLHVCTLFNKPKRRLIRLPLRYIGFDLPDRFVVGYGLDFRQRFRNLPFVGLLHPETFRPAG